MTWSFISDRDAAPFGGGDWSLANPISEDLKVMRPSLLPGLLAAAQRNQNRGADSIRLFEIGRRYLADAEHPTLAVLMAGDKRARGWQAGKAAPFDAFDAKAAALALLDAAGAPADRLQVMEAVSRGQHLAPRPVGDAAARPQGGARRIWRAPPAADPPFRCRRPGDGGADLPRRDPRRSARAARRARRSPRPRCNRCAATLRSWPRPA